MAEAEKSRETWPLEYKMNNKQRGVALIFNQEKIKDFKPRRGSAQDKQSLIDRFQALGFEVIVHDDKNKEEMLAELRKAAEQNHKDNDCFVCVILSHGEEDHIYASDSEVKIQGITDLFRGDNCKSLVGKPKIFIIQACAGEACESPVTPMAGWSSSEDDEHEELQIYSIPAGADFLICNSAVKGFVSLRDTVRGTFYIQYLCETLEEHGSTLEFTELLTLVSLKVSRHDMKGKKQMPCFTSMLTKKLYFRPKK